MQTSCKPDNIHVVSKLQSYEMLFEISLEIIMAFETQSRNNYFDDWYTIDGGLFFELSTQTHWRLKNESRYGNNMQII